MLIGSWGDDHWVEAVTGFSFPSVHSLGTLADELASRLLKCFLYAPHRKDKDRLEQKKNQIFPFKLKATNEAC